jgi:hypothetical protein
LGNDRNLLLTSIYSLDTLLQSTFFDDNGDTIRIQTFKHGILSKNVEFIWNEDQIIKEERLYDKNGSQISIKKFDRNNKLLADEMDISLRLTRESPINYPLEIYVPNLVNNLMVVVISDCSKWGKNIKDTISILKAKKNDRIFYNYDLPNQETFIICGRVYDVQIGKEGKEIIRNMKPFKESINIPFAVRK